MSENLEKLLVMKKNKLQLLVANEKKKKKEKDKSEEKRFISVIEIS